MAGDIRDFDTKKEAAHVPAETVALESEEVRIKLQLAEFVDQVLPKLSEHQFHRLLSAVPEHILHAEMEQVDVKGVSIEAEIANLVRGVRAMSQSIMLNGQLKTGIDHKEAASVFKQTADLIKLLIGFQEEIMNIERLKKVEEATLRVFKEHFSDVQSQAFCDHLEALLSE